MDLRIPTYMSNSAHRETSALIQETREHLSRIRGLLESSREQFRLASELIEESRRFIELIEEIEAQRIKRLHGDLT